MQSSASAVLFLVLALLAVSIAYARQRHADIRERKRLARVFELIELRLNKVESIMTALPTMMADALKKSKEP